MEYPWMRKELLETLQALSDIEYQKKIWINRELSPQVEDNFDLAVHFIYDDTTLASDPQSLINIILKNEDEVRLIEEVVNALDSVFDDVGMEVSDEEYISSSKWPEVLKAAYKAYQAMKD